MHRGPLIILSGASGSGKSTVVSEFLARTPQPMHLSISATTRKPRVGEVDGVHYYFWTRERFLAELEAGAFLEHAEVYGNLYGTLRSEVEPFRDAGSGVVLVIDVQGAERLRSVCPDAVTVFLRTSTEAVFEARLRARGTDDEPTILRRLASAHAELACADRYHFQILNDDLHDAVGQLQAVVDTQFSRGSECSTS